MTAFADTAVIMYAGGGAHPLQAPCRALLRALAHGDVDLVTSAEVIQEILHRFSVVRSRHIGRAMARHALDLFAPVVPITHGVMDRMPGLFERHPGLAARDLVHTATCQEEGIDRIVSPDRAFDDVEGLVRLDPAAPGTLAVLT